MKEGIPALSKGVPKTGVSALRGAERAGKEKRDA